MPIAMPIPHKISDVTRYGKCSSLTAEQAKIFFPKPHNKVEEERKRAAPAKAICTGKDGLGECPVREACLAFALKYKEQGVWGGTTDKEREKIKRRNKVYVEELYEKYIRDN